MAESRRLEEEKVGTADVESSHPEKLPINDPEYEQKLKKLLWKCDLHVLPSISILFFLAFMDRTNIGIASAPSSPTQYAGH
jgi:hypothetical protein